MANRFRTASNKIYCSLGSMKIPSFIYTENVSHKITSCINSETPLLNLKKLIVTVPPQKQHFTLEKTTSEPQILFSEAAVKTFPKRSANSTVPPPFGKNLEPESDPINSNRKADDEQLEKAFQDIKLMLENLLKKQVNYQILHKNITLENNIRGTCHYGRERYVMQVGLLRMYLLMKFAYSNLNILKITKHPEDSTIRCRWRIVGIPSLEPIFKFWKFLPRLKKFPDPPTWLDGFSVYHVGTDGLITKHVIDKMQPDDDRQVDQKIPPKSGIERKLAFCLGLTKLQSEFNSNKSLGSSHGSGDIK